MQILIVTFLLAACKGEEFIAMSQVVCEWIKETSNAGQGVRQWRLRHCR
jgi:hypothetical protein